MKTLPAFFELEKFGISPADVTRMVFHCEPEEIHPDVILMPWWQPEIFRVWVGEINTLRSGVLFETEYKGKPISIVRSGVGAPLAGDSVLALGCTPCRRILFAGSVGGLSTRLRIGDLLVPSFSYSGDGFCRYLEPGFPPRDCCQECIAPDNGLTQAITSTTALFAEEAGVAMHRGPVFCIDSILAQFGKLEYLANELGCLGIEMETAAVFKVARMVGIQASALLSVSDVPIQKQSLFAGRSEAEQSRRREIRRTVLARAVLDCFAAAEQQAGG
jgi:purine-nucleoside phosphorylase